MNGFSKKICMELIPPTEENPVSDQQQLMQALAELGYAPVQVSLNALRMLHPACISGEYRITVTLVLQSGMWHVVNVEAGDTRNLHYGLAVDYGSTTIVMELVDVLSGSTIARETLPNGQRAYGTDILTRITHAMQDAAHAQELRNVTLDTFNRLLEALSQRTGIDTANVPVMILSGNTTMIHFLLQLDGWTVFSSPYAPVTLNPGWFSGRELGMNFNGSVYIIPAASNYIGGDIISGLLTLDFHRQDGLGVFFDIGTNGELVMGNRHWLLAGAGAAGPALEGYISRFGVRAQPGAVDSVSIRDGELLLTTIGGARPIGICGSGIIDLIAQMRLSGWINIAGELNPAASPRIRRPEGAQEYAVVYADENESGRDEALYFSQTDIKQYLETKAAAHTMVDCLLEAAGCSEDDIDKFHLSGAFSAHSNLESAITVGIFPDLPREKFALIPNSSLDGARKLLLNRDLLAEAEELTQRLYCVQFASIPDFIIRMYAAKFIPHTDMQRYPSIAARVPD